MKISNFSTHHHFYKLTPPHPYHQNSLLSPLLTACPRHVVSAKPSKSQPPFFRQHPSTLVPDPLSFRRPVSFCLLFPRHSPLSDLLPLLPTLLHITEKFKFVNNNQWYTSNVNLSKPSQHPKPQLHHLNSQLVKSPTKVSGHQQLYTIGSATAAAAFHLSCSLIHCRPTSPTTFHQGEGGGYTRISSVATPFKESGITQQPYIKWGQKYTFSESSLNFLSKNGNFTPVVSVALILLAPMFQSCRDTPVFT